MSDLIGKRFNKSMTFHESAKILGTSNVKLLEFLRQNEIVFKDNDRNLPYSKYLNMGWFDVIQADVENKTFSAIIPIVRITSKGFENIKILFLDKGDEYLNFYTENNFMFYVEKFTINKMLKLGFKVDLKNKIDFIKKNTITYNKHNTTSYTIFLFGDNGEKINLITYDTKNKTIKKYE